MGKFVIILLAFRVKYGLEVSAHAQLDLILMALNAFNVLMVKDGIK